MGISAIHILLAIISGANVIVQPDKDFKFLWGILAFLWGAMSVMEVWTMFVK